MLIYSSLYIQSENTYGLPVTVLSISLYDHVFIF